MSFKQLLVLPGNPSVRAALHTGQDSRLTQWREVRGARRVRALARGRAEGTLSGRAGAARTSPPGTHGGQGRWALLASQTVREGLCGNGFPELLVVTWVQFNPSSSLSR